MPKRKWMAITNWFYEGLEITEVMRLAGHSKYETSLKFYLSVKDDLVDRARQAVRHSVSREMLERGVSIFLIDWWERGRISGGVKNGLIVKELIVLER